MSKVIVIGNDPALRGRIESFPHRGRRRGRGVQVEYLDFTDIDSLARKRPQAVVMDVRSPSPTMFAVFTRLKSRTHQPSLLLQVTPRQQQDQAWGRILPTSRTALFTSQTSKTEIQKMLQYLLEVPRNEAKPPATPAEQPMKTNWHEQNARRIDFIFKERDASLTPSEQAELAKLQEEANRKVDRRQSLDFDALAEFNAQARTIAEGGMTSVACSTNDSEVITATGRRSQPYSEYYGSKGQVEGETNG